jgi:pyruvate/2-oxoglutarate/acetoin dehydrogenase E1 component
VSELLYYEARARAIARELEANPEAFLLGGSITPPFLPDDGLGARFGERIVWPPISEFANCGLAVGAAIAGMRPLVAISTASFMFYGFAAIVLEAANVRYLSGGAVGAPAAFHVLAGSRRGGGAQHEHTPQAMLQNVPGLRVLAPGTTADVDAAIHEAFTGPDPLVIIDHVLLSSVRGEVPDQPRLPVASLIREGSDALIVSYSLMLQRSLAVAEQGVGRGASIAVLDVPVINPLPLAEVLAEISRFERVLFVDESRGPGSPVSHIMAAVLDAGLSCRCRLLCTADAPAPFAPTLLDEVVPTEQRIAAVLEELLETAAAAAR